MTGRQSSKWPHEEAFALVLTRTWPEAALKFERTRSGHLFVRATADGCPDAHLLLDTGASHSVVARSSPMAARASIVESRVKATASGGEIEAVSLVKLADVTIGAWRISGLHAASMDFGPLEARLGTGIEGILGNDVFSRNGISFDFDTDEMCLSARHGPIAERLREHTWCSLPFAITDEGLLSTELRVSGARIPAVIDFGAARSVVNVSGGRVLGKAPDSGSASSDRSIGLDGRVLPMGRCVVSPYEIGDMTFAEGEMLVADLPIFRKIWPETPAALIGLNVFAKRIVVIDYDRQRIACSTLPA